MLKNGFLGLTTRENDRKTKVGRMAAECGGVGTVGEGLGGGGGGVAGWGGVLLSTKPGSWQLHSWPAGRQHRFLKVKAVL